MNKEFFIRDQFEKVRSIERMKLHSFEGMKGLRLFLYLADRILSRQNRHHSSINYQGKRHWYTLVVLGGSDLSRIVREMKEIIISIIIKIVN